MIGPGACAPEQQGNGCRPWFTRAGFSGTVAAPHRTPERIDRRQDDQVIGCQASKDDLVALVRRPAREPGTGEVVRPYH